MIATETTVKNYYFDLETATTILLILHKVKKTIKKNKVLKVYYSSYKNILEKVKTAYKGIDKETGDVPPIPLEVEEKDLLYSIFINIRKGQKEDQYTVFLDTVIQKLERDDN